MRPVVSAALASLLPALAGCAVIPQLLAPGASAPAPVPTGGENAPTAAQLAPQTPAASSMQKSDYAERTLSVGKDELRLSLPCAPKGDDPEKEQSDLGPLQVATYACDYETTNLSYTVLATRFDRALPAAAKDSDRDAKSAAIAKVVAREACQGLKQAGATCKVGTPLIVEGVASVNVKVGGSAPIALEVQGRYPYAVAVFVSGQEGAPEATSKALASLKLPAP